MEVARSMGLGAALAAVAIAVLSLILDLKYVGPWFHAIAANVPTQLWNPAVSFLYLQGFPFVISLVVVSGVIGAIFGRGRR